MKHIRRGYSHIKYTWEDTQGCLCSITLHMLDHKLALYGIPKDAKRTAMYYWYDRFDSIHWKEVH